MLSTSSEGVILKVKVLPRSSTNQIYKIEKECLKIKVTSPADKDLANKALIELLADIFHIPKSWIKILRGSRSREKTLCLLQQNEEKIRQILSSFR